MEKKKRQFKVPHSLAIIVVVMIAAATMEYELTSYQIEKTESVPSGQYPVAYCTYNWRPKGPAEIAKV